MTEMYRYEWLEHQGLERGLRVQFDTDAVGQRYRDQLRQTAKRARLPGFRKGRVPTHVVEQHYGQHVQADVANDLMQSSLNTILEKEDVRLASRPELVESPQDKDTTQPTLACDYEVRFEVYPALTLEGLDALKVDKPVAEATNAQVDDAIANLLKQHRAWEKVEVEAAAGHRLTVDFKAVDGEGQTVPGTDAQGHTFVLGEGAMLPDFEQPLEGKTAGDTVEFDLTFPEDYHAKELNGTTVHFTVTLHEVAEGKEPAIDQDLFTTLGLTDVEDEAGFRAAIMKPIQAELQEKCDEIAKHRLFAALLDHVQFDVPKAMVNETFNRLRQETFGKQTSFDVKTLKQLQRRALYQSKVALLIQHILDAKELTLDNTRFDDTLQAMTPSYLDHETFRSWVMGNENMLRNLQSRVLEAQAVDALMADVTVVEAPMSYDEVAAALEAVNNEVLGNGDAEENQDD